MAEPLAAPDETPAGEPSPAVAAVVVCRNPGPWFDDALAAIAAQDYGRLRVLVVDAASSDDPTDRIMAHLPDAVVVRTPDNPGYGAAANIVRSQVRGADHLLFLHDDVALAPHAVTDLVAEAVRSNAGICGPKLVDWDDPSRIRHVGASIDKTGVQAPLAEPGELDQEQHDRVRDVFLVAGGAMLVRADLFETVGGFDPTIDFLGDDLDLCWRAQLAGARVMIVPDAVARHRESLGDRRSTDDRRRLLVRHRIRTMLVCYGWLHLIRVVPQAAVLSLAEIAYSLVVGRFAQARDVARGPIWNLRRLPDLLRARRRAQRTRRLRDGEIRRLQVRGSARLTSFLRGQIGDDARLADLAERGRAMAVSLTGGPQRTVLLTWAVIALALVVGSRHLITRGIPGIGDFAALPSPGALVDDHLGGWREVGLGAAGVGPMASLLLGLAGWGFLGATGLLRSVLILGLLPVAALGAWRLARPMGSRRARLATAIGYLLVPLLFNAVALGDWPTMLVVAALPWCLSRVARLSRVAPFGAVGGESGPGVTPRSIVHQVIALGLLLAVVAAFAPWILLLVPAMALAVLVGAVVAGSIVPPARAVIATVVAAALGAALHLPSILQLRTAEAAWNVLTGIQPLSRPDELDELIRFDTGPLSGSWLTVAGLGVAAVPLLVARDWRLAWAARAWALILGGSGAAWAAGRGWVPIDMPPTGALLAPAALGLALAAGLAVAAYEQDVAGRAFGWRQLFAGLAAGAGLIWAVPALGAVLAGDWDAPRTDWGESLGFIDLDETDGDGSFRVAWLGGAEVLPVAGWPVGDGDLVAGTSVDGSGDVRDAFVLPDDGGGEMLAAAVDHGLSGRTARMGRLLAPMGVRYVVVLQKSTPSFDEGTDRPIGAAAEQALASQLDLRRVATDPAALVYENLAWLPRRALVTDQVVPEEVDPGQLAVAPPVGGVPVLAERIGVREQRGVVGAGTVVMTDVDADDWELTVDGAEQPGRQAFGSAKAFAVETDGTAVLRHQRPTRTLLVVAAQVIAWLVVARIALAEAGRRRWRRRRSTP